MNRDQHIIRADQTALLRQVSPNAPLRQSGIRVKWHDLDSGQEGHQRKSILFRPGAVADAEFQLCHRNGGNAHFLRPVLHESPEHTFRATVLGVGDDIGIQHELHS